MSNEAIEQIDSLRQASLDAIRDAASAEALQQARSTLIGRKGKLTKILKGLGKMSPDDRRKIGIAANEFKAEFERLATEREHELIDASSPLAPDFDFTRPGLLPPSGGLHPITQMTNDLVDAFISLGFEIFEGPELSSELYAFDHLNFPPEHPARDSMDTYWLDGRAQSKGADRLCLRPHLTGGSVRFMQTHEPPYRFVYPGRVYRNESTDASHERAFFQFEALIVERRFPFAAGKVLIDTILATVFGREVETRMRAGFFPFVEPGFEIDMQCLVCDGAGCSVCKQVGWLEVMPGGAPHPHVLTAAGVDPREWEGFYINIGLDRLVMMRYGVDDVRLFHSADLRFLNQFQ